MSLINELYKTVHKSTLGTDQIAERLGMSQKWSLYKMVDPTNSDYRFPAEWLIGLMQNTKNFRCLHYIAQQCGFVCIRYSRFKLGKEKDLTRLGEMFGHASSAIVRMYEQGVISREDYECVYGLLKEIAGHLKVADKIRSGQLELNL